MQNEVKSAVDLSQVDPDGVAQWLESTGRYRVFRRIETCEDFHGQVTHPVHVLVLDTETTGLDLQASELIEVGAILLEVDRDTGCVGRVVGSYGGLEEPQYTIPEESTAIHGITNDMVKGQRFDDDALAELVQRADLCIAHNAGFDKPFLLRRFACFASSTWACTLKEIPWAREGYAERKLGSLLSDYGYFHDAHRAVEDCNALIHVLSKPLKTSQNMPFQVLFDSANQPIYQIAALKAPFEKKDLLKAKGFRWNADDRVWELDAIGFAEGKEAIEWLREYVYCTSNKIMLGFRTQMGPERYSGTPSKQQFKEV